MTSPPRVIRPTRPPRPGVQPPIAESTSGMSSARISLGRVFRAESSNYLMLLGLTLFMVVFGLIMVLSSSSVVSHATTNNFFSAFWSQGIFALIGLPLMLIASRMPSRFWKKSAWVLLAGSCLLQVVVLTTPLGLPAVGGNRNWLHLGGLTGQPSEAIKVALALWLGVVLARKQDLLGKWKHVVIPLIPIGGGAILLVTIGGDLGTTMIMAGFVLGALFFAGVKLRHLIIGSAVIASAAVVVALTSASRVGRISAFFGGTSAVNPDVQWQINNGNYALASGGIFGVGLGNSHAKWSWLPAADTDFIFAVIGEELGLIGAVLVLVLFVLLAITFLRIINASTDPFARITTAAIMVWIIGQALVNIGVVLGVIPVLGVPLPLISAGGTAMISSMFAIGIVLSFARESSRAHTRA
ncbi:MAG: cell division protein FtsW [Microbacteriaceae bacterium]|nr:cell division protein FtsW [Microbacteriaceae bacterium]